MTISVVIATHNRARLLASTLEAVAAQESPSVWWEIVVVDNGSTDETAEVVRTAASRAPVPVVYLRETRSGKSHALNTAMPRARGELIVLTDDDVLPSPGWLNAYLAAFREDQADYAAGRIFPLWEAAPPRWLSPRLYGVLAVADGGPFRLELGGGLNQQIMPIGANMAVRRHVLDRIGGWNAGLGKLQGTLRTGEDHEFALRMARAGCKGLYVPEAWVRHRVPADRLRLPYFSRWYIDNGAIVAGLDQEYAPGARELLGVPRYLWRRAAADVLGATGAAVRLNVAAGVASAMRLFWFGGYVRARWTRRATAAVEAQPVVLRRS
ncbi:MAG TPA: glycosyltransferase [Vicinamibacterales bacterium]|nr:glycosyltransferase [Vicinamibacterales bacterium]